MTSMTARGHGAVGASPDVLIVGGGVIGCAAAYACTKAGLRVMLVERERIGAGASSAAAGLLAPQVEAFQPDDFFQFGLAGRAEHAPLSAQLLDELGMDVEYRASGVLRVALEEPQSRVAGTRRSGAARAAVCWCGGQTAGWCAVAPGREPDTPAQVGTSAGRHRGACWRGYCGRHAGHRTVERRVARHRCAHSRW